MVKEAAGECELIECILLNDYMMQFKQRPPKIFELQNLPERKQMIQLMVEKLGFDEDMLSHYTSCCAGFYQGKRAVQMLIYNAQHQKPERVWITQELDVIREDER
jgi:hypothetical protein